MNQTVSLEQLLFFVGIMPLDWPRRSKFVLYYIWVHGNLLLLCTLYLKERAPFSFFITHVRAVVWSLIQFGRHGVLDVGNV